jgi:DNA-binding CsgD family transcriptional regulator
VDLVLAEDPEHSQALLVRAEVSYHEESFPEAQRLYLRLLDQDIEPRLRVIAEIGLAYVLSNLMQWQSAAALCRRALARAEEIGAPGLAAQAMAHCAMMDFLSGRGVDEPMVERSLRLEDVDPLVSVTRSPRTIAAFLDLFAGRHAAAREALAALCADARARGDESDLAFVLLWSSWLETRSGAFATAATVADEAVSLAALTGSRQVHAWARTQRALVHAHAGEDEEARRLCDEARDPVRESGNLLPVLWLAGTTALVELSVGDPAAAWRACEPLAQALERDGIGEPVPSFWLPDGLEALIALGQTARADALVTQLEAAAQRLDRAWALATAGRCRGLLLLGEGDAAAALPVLEGALAIHDRIDLPFDRARTLLTRGVVERRVGRRKAARESMMQARHAFSGMGARLWERRAQEELGRIPIRRGAAAGELTPAERRIAELVARGRSNREVADALFLSPKTVEAGLTRIYRKLGLRSRAALAAEWSDS